MRPDKRLSSAGIARASQDKMTGRSVIFWFLLKITMQIFMSIIDSLHYKYIYGYSPVSE
jgi:hypothetical protein